MILEIASRIESSCEKRYRKEQAALVSAFCYEEILENRIDLEPSQVDSVGDKSTLSMIGAGANHNIGNLIHSIVEFAENKISKNKHLLTQTNKQGRLDQEFVRSNLLQNLLKEMEVRADPSQLAAKIQCEDDNQKTMKMRIDDENEKKVTTDDNQNEKKMIGPA